jgi:hypothetical protein
MNPAEPKQRNPDQPRRPNPCDAIHVTQTRAIETQATQ